MKRLDIDPAAVALMPHEPSEILTRCFGSGKSLPRKEIIGFAAVSNQPCALAFMNSIRQVKASDLKKLSFEAMCVHARVNPMETLGAIMSSAIQMKGVESRLKAALAHPEVVEATVEAAKAGEPIMVGGVPLRDDDGKLVRYRGDVAAQRIMHEAVGFLPTKKGGGIEINLGFGRPAEERDSDSDADDDWDDAFPALGEQIQEFSADKHKLLEGKKD